MDEDVCGVAVVGAVLGDVSAGNGGIRVERITKASCSFRLNDILEYCVMVGDGDCKGQVMVSRLYGSRWSVGPDSVCPLFRCSSIRSSNK